MYKLFAYVSLLFLLSCGTIPVPKTSSGNKPAKAGIDSRPAKVTTASAPAPEIKPAVAPEVKPLPSRQDTISVNDHVKKGILLLQNGEVAQAKAELFAALRRDPGNIDAVNLVHQINTDASVYFAGEDYFVYEIRAGDTLSSVAGKFLDDPLKFYILAKFNGVGNPATLTTGQKIKVPGEKNKQTETTAPATAAPKATESEIQYELASKYYEAGKYQVSIDILEKFSNAALKNTQYRDLLVLSYTKYAEELAEKADLLEAQTVLEKALSMQPRNSQLQKQLEALAVRREADREYQRGVDALQAGDKNKSYEYFRKALELQPDHLLARKQISTMKSELVDTYYKKAMQLYSKQQLLDAIKYWDKVLDLDPNHAT